MSTMLSTISRQLVSTSVVYQTHSVHSSLSAPSMCGMYMSSSVGALPSGSCQMKSMPSWSRVGQARVLATGGTRRA